MACLDGLKFVGMFRWPGAIHEGRGEAAVVVDERANEAERGALLRVLTGQDTEPGATIFQVFSTTPEKRHDPIFAPIDFEVDIDARQALIVLQGAPEGRGEPIKNPVTGGRVSRAHRYAIRFRIFARGNGPGLDHGVASVPNELRRVLWPVCYLQSQSERRHQITP